MRSTFSDWMFLILAVLPALTAQDPIRVGVELVTTDVRVRDQNGRFVANLDKADFDVHEDGVRQQIVTFVTSLGGRIYNGAAPPPTLSREGVIVPPVRPKAETGRVFVIFVDDEHLDPRLTNRVRHFLKSLSSELIHDGDMFAAVSSGPSSIEIPLTYDRKRLDRVISKVMGNGLSPNEILSTPVGAQGHALVRHKAHVAFSTAWGIMRDLEQVQHRRKAFIYISSGYDFAPFEQARAREEAERYGRGTDDPNAGNPFMRQGTQFSEADLAMELSELTRAANRANASIYTIDPRGLPGGPDLDQQIDMVEWQTYVTGSQNSLRVLAELTGGFATVNRNDLVAALRRIDQETSDYYVIGYYSTNTDTTKRRRTIDVKVKQPGVQVHHRTEYVLRR